MPSREDILANITTGPGRPSRGDILANMTTGIQGPLIDLVKRPKDRPQRTPITTEQLFPRPEPVQLPGAPEPEPGPFEFAGPLGKFIDLIDTPRAAIVSTIKEVGDLFRGEGFSPVDWWKQTEDNIFMHEVMRDWDVDLPGPLEMVIGLGFDIAFDPVTYATGGVAAAARAGLNAPKLIKTMSRGAAYYDDIARGGVARSGVTVAQAEHKASVLKQAVVDVGKSNAMHSAGPEALREVGLLGQMGLFVPATGRLGRAVRVDKVLDAASRGAVTTRRARQASRLPYIGDLARPVSGKVVDDAAEAVARFGREGLEDAAAAEAKIIERMKMIRRGEALPDIADDFYTAAARVASRMPVEAFKLPGFTGNALKWTVPAFGKVKANLFSRAEAEVIDKAFNTKASLKKALRSGDYETVLAANKAMTSNSAGWAARNRFMDLMSKPALQLRRTARRLGLPDAVVDDMFRTELYDYSPGVKAPRQGPDGLPLMNPEFRAKFGSHLGRVGEQPVMDFWHQGRKWMDDALINANVLGGGTPWLAKSADELWVMRLPLGGRKPYSPEAFRELIPGGEFLGVPLLSQVDDPLKRTVEDQVRGIVKSQFGDDAEELFDPNIWKSMDRYLSKIGESVRRAKVLNLLEEQGVAFKEPLAWIKGQIDEGYDALKGLYGNRGQAFDEVFRGIEAGFDPEQVKALRMAMARREGASAMGEQTAAWVAEVEIIEAKLVELQIRLAEKMSSVTRGARRSTEALGEFMKPLLQEASVLGYRQAQLEAISAMLAKQGKAVAPTITDEQLLAQLTKAFGKATAEMRVLVQEAKSLAAVDDSVKEMRRLIAALQEPLNQLDQQGLLDAFPEVPKMREWLGGTFDVREILEDDRLGVGLDYLDLSGISVEKLPQWMREVQESWQDVTAAYRGAVDRGYAEGVAMNEWRQRQALAGGILLGKDSPFVRLEAFKGVDGKWHYMGAPVRGGAEVAEGQPLKWTKAPTEEVPFGRRPAREPKFSIPSEEELELAHAPARVTYASSKDELAMRLAQLAGKAPSQEELTEEAIRAATGMTLAERQALRRREWKAWTDTGKHVGPKPRRTAWKGESAMSVREVDGRRQIDTWIIEPAGAGWAVSVNGEVVGRAGSLKKAKEVAQAEATKRLGMAPTPRAAAAAAVTPPAGGALPSVLSQTHVTGRGLTVGSLYERINLGNGVPIIDPPGTTYGDLQKQGRTHFAFDPVAEVISLEEVRQLPDKYPEYYKRIPGEGTRLELIEPISPAKHTRPLDDTGLPGPVLLDESVSPVVYADAPVHVPEKPWTTLPPPNLGDDVADELARKIMFTRLSGATQQLADLMSSNLEDAQEAASSMLLRDIMDAPPTTEQVAAVQRYLRERTQEFLASLPDEVTVYRFGNLDRPGVATPTAGGAPLSFTLNPRYNYRADLPWSEHREVAGERFVAYTAKRSDIELALDMGAGKAAGEDELLIHPANVRPVPEGAPTARAVAAEAVTPPPAAAGAVTDLTGVKLPSTGTAVGEPVQGADGVVYVIYKDRDLVTGPPVKGGRGRAAGGTTFVEGDVWRVYHYEPDRLVPEVGPRFNMLGYPHRSLEEAQRSVRGSAEAVTPPTETTLGITGVGEKILEDYSAAELAKMKAAAGEPPWGAFTETEAWEEVGRIEEAKELFRKGEIDADEMARRQTIPDEEIDRMYKKWGREDAEEGLAKFGFEETIAERRAAEAVTPPAAAAADKAARRAVARRKVIAACTEGKCPMAEGATVAAEDLYTGEPFKFMRRRIDASDAELGAIISAKHGVLDPAELVGSYDVKLPRQDSLKLVAGDEQLEKFAALVGDAEELYFYGSGKYRMLMMNLLGRAQKAGLVGRNVRVVHPTGTGKAGGARGAGEYKKSLGNWAGKAQPSTAELAAAVTPPPAAVTPPPAAAAGEGFTWTATTITPLSESASPPKAGRTTYRLAEPIDTFDMGRMRTFEYEIRPSGGKHGGWMLWRKEAGRGVHQPEFHKVDGGGNMRVPSPSNPDKTMAVPGAWRTLEDAQAKVESLQGLTARAGAAEAVTPPPAAVTPPPAAPKAPAAAPKAAARDPLGLYGADPAEQVVVRTPFGDFQLKFAKPGPGGTSKVKVVESPEALKAWPAKTGPKVPGTRAPLGPGKEFRDYYEAEEAIGRWAEEVYEARWSGTGIIHKDRRAEVAQGAIGEMWADPARQPGVRQALATLTGRTEITGFVGVEGLAWMDEPMWSLPIDWNRTGGLLTDVEKDLLRDTERLAHLAYASEHYRIAEAAMGQGLVEEAEIAMMQGRLADLNAEKAAMAKAGATKEAGIVPELYDAGRTDLDLFQGALRKFNAARTRDLFGEALTAQTAAQWGPNTENPVWSRGWSAPLQAEDQAPLFSMLNALFKTTSTAGEFSKYLRWYDKFLNYWKAQAVSTPGFVLRNGLGGSWLSYAFGLMELGSTNKFAGTYFRAMRSGKGDAVAGIDDMIGKLLESKKTRLSVGFGARVDVNELRTIRRVLESGIVGGGQVITEIDRSVATRLFKESRNPITGNPIDVVFNPASTEFAPFRFIRSSNEQMETVLRGSLAFDVLNKGGSIGDAAGMVYKLHFNYADLTATERKMRRIIPFWTWQKNVVPVLVESLGKHPYAWGRLQQVKGNLELQSKEEGVVPDYFMENMAIRLPWKINDYQSYWIPDLPFRDLNRLLKEPTSITRVFAESAAPPVKVPLEIWAGKQFFADLPFSGRYQQVPHVYDKFPFLMRALDLAGKAKKNKKGEWKMRDQDLYMLDSWMPFLSRFRRMLPNEKRYSRRVASTVVSTVFGTQIRINDPQETRNQMLRNDRAYDEKVRDLIDIEMRLR